MENIELVIKMPKETYNHIMSMQFFVPGARHGKTTLEKILNAIRTGTPLPKGHGRLIDADALDITTVITDDYSGNEVLDVVLQEDINDAPTIIEADESEGEYAR